MSERPTLTFEIDDCQSAVYDYLTRIDEVISLKDIDCDPVLVSLAEQIGNQLRNITYDYKIVDGDDFPYSLGNKKPFPPIATQHALKKAQRFFDLLNTDISTTTPVIEFDDGYEHIALSTQQDNIRKLITDPLDVYDEFSRRRAEGDQAQFPELGWTLKGLLCDMATKPEVEAACAKSLLLAKLRDILVTDINERVQKDFFAYQPTILAIEDAVSFFDLVVRTNDPTAPPLYHSARFGYNWNTLIDDPELTILPTMAGVSISDLLSIRGVPIGIVGVSTSTITVDGFPQTPYEFFYHDIDHTRRMHDETQAAIEREGVSARTYAKQASELIHTVLLPSTSIEEITDEDEIDRRMAMRMILFECLHEDGYDPTRDTIAEAILRPPMEQMPFERLVDGKTIEYFTSPRATTLAHVFRKLAHTFYDLPDQRSKTLGSDFVRTRVAISHGAADLYQLVSDDPIEYDMLLTTCRDLVSTDEGFTDSFISNIANDIARRGVGRNALKLMVSRPMGVAAAVRQVRKSGSYIHSLFGYSALEYEDPIGLEQRVITDLSEFDPFKTAIAIGATPYGIGRLYPTIKELGFRTLGIVASTALGNSEECADGVDEVIVVKDSGWGGYRYNQRSSGLLSPTTRVFVGASDSIAAYGGGNITAVTLQEARRRNKPISFMPFDMNHKIADMMHAQRGDTSPIDYAGPANAKWLQLIQE